jgi:GNAT superfamily N-acetyltransferase
MELRSLGYRTNLIFPRFDGEVHDRGEYLVVRTPSNPNFWWGNFLLFAAPPGVGDRKRWEALFAQEIGVPPAVQHRVFGWDSPEGERGEIGPFLEAGYEPEEYIVLTARQVNPPPKWCEEVTVRPLVSDDDWEQATVNQILCRDAWHTEEAYTPYKRNQMVRYRAMAAAGLGNAFGAFLGERLVGDLGIYRDGPVARFQSVVVHPDFRRRGICGTMVYEASRYALEGLGVETLVMEADEHYHAARIYESVGFRPTERSIGVQYRPKAEGVAA